MDHHKFHVVVQQTESNYHFDTEGPRTPEKGEFLIESNVAYVVKDILTYRTGFTATPVVLVERAIEDDNLRRLMIELQNKL